MPRFEKALTLMFALFCRRDPCCCFCQDATRRLLPRREAIRAPSAMKIRK